MAHQIASYESRLIRGLGLSKREALEFLDRLVPTVLLGDVTGFEASDAFFQRPFMAVAAQAAVAGQFSHVAIFNPPESGVDVLLEAAFILVDAAAQVRIRTGTDVLTTLVSTKGFRDLRLTGLPAMEPRAEANAAVLGDQVGSVEAAAAPGELVPLDFLVNPGRTLILQNPTANVSLTATFWGWEQNRE